MINIYTHSKIFHSNEIMAIMLLLKYYVERKQYKIIRTRDKDILEKAKYDNNSFVIDVGFLYDADLLC